MPVLAPYFDKFGFQVSSMMMMIYNLPICPNVFINSVKETAMLPKFQCQQGFKEQFPYIFSFLIYIEEG